MAKTIHQNGYRAKKKSKKWFRKSLSQVDEQLSFLEKL